MNVREAIKRIPGSVWLHRKLVSFYVRHLGEPFPRGHFYSPLPGLADVLSKSEELFRTDIDLPGIDLKEDSQLSLLSALASHMKDFDLPSSFTSGFRYYAPNDYFGPGCARVTASMLLHLRPRRVIEVGSGFSSAIMLDVDQHRLHGSVEFTFIDPHPARLLELLRPEDFERHALLAQAVQDVPLQLFGKLEANDILFVDSSHVAKVGSDVNHLVFHILPQLRPGVVIHFHDVFWPFEYPLGWIVDQKRSWNEAYLLRAFLQFNRAFEILFFPQYLWFRKGSEVQRIWPELIANPGASLWLRKCQPEEMGEPTEGNGKRR